MHYNVLAVQKPGEEQIAAIEDLIATCNVYEGLHMRLDRDMLRDRPDNASADFLYYENGILIGYLGLSNWGAEEKELTGMVHPDHRHKGIFRALFTAARTACSQRGVKRLLLICEHASLTGQAFVKAVDARYEHAEHEMILTAFQPRLAFDDRLIFRPATDDDLDMIVSILGTEFQDDEVLTRQRVLQILQHPHQRFYVSTLGNQDVGCQEPVGSLRLDDHEDIVGIYGFVVRAEYRGRGYGRQMLEEAIRTIQAESQKKVMLDVDVNNSRAMSLYMSAGFIIKTTYDYYRLDIL